MRQGAPNPDGDRTARNFIIFHFDGKMMVVDFNEGETSDPRELFDTGLNIDPIRDQYAVTPDGQRFLLLKRLQKQQPLQSPLLSTGPPIKKMTISTGTRLSHYEITSPDRRQWGGIPSQGSEARARCRWRKGTTPEEFAKDTDRIARFQREAKLLASLNQSKHITAIYGLEESYRYTLPGHGAY